MEFTEVTGSGNPFDGVTVANHANFAFLDVNGDGLPDAFIGEGDGTVNYFENTGTSDLSAFTEITGAGNPLNGVDVGNYATIAFLDVNGDGLPDAFIGEWEGSIKYFENTGTSDSAAFAEITGSGNPLNGVDVGDYSNIDFLDANGDGLPDAFIGEGNGNINYFENTGTSDSAAFTARTGAENPFDGVDVGDRANIAFLDANGDGDFDDCADCHTDEDGEFDDYADCHTDEGT